MGFQLGPGFLRRPPKGWLPARAFPVQHRTQADSGTGGDGSSSIDTSCTLAVLWRVEAEDGRAPYEFDEQRRAPLWLLEGSIVGGGNRWYKPRLRGSHGLMPALGVPCRVDPRDPYELWIDWDAAHAEHEPAWDRQSRIDRELNRRKGLLDHVVDRVTSPLAGRIRPEEEALVDDALAAERRRVEAMEAQYAALGEQRLAAIGFGPVPPAERAEYDALLAAGARIHASGRAARATVVANQDTGRTLANIPEIHITLDVQDGAAVRRLVYRHVSGPRHAKRYKPGRTVEVRIDPDDPDAVTLAS